LRRKCARGPFGGCWIAKVERDSANGAGVPSEIADMIKAMEREIRERRQTRGG
jgi:hypothetical protein